MLQVSGFFFLKLYKYMYPPTEITETMLKAYFIILMHVMAWPVKILYSVLYTFIFKKLKINKNNLKTILLMKVQFKICFMKAMAMINGKQASSLLGLL